MRTNAQTTSVSHSLLHLLVSLLRHTAEFAFEIGSNLLTEVRRLQALLADRDKAIQDLKEERDKAIQDLKEDPNKAIQDLREDPDKAIQGLKKERDDHERTIEGLKTALRQQEANAG